MEMWIAPVVAVALTFALWQTHPAEWFFQAPLLLLWLLSPALGWWISKPLLLPVPDLSIDQRRFLRMAARRTWRFFADFVGFGPYPRLHKLA